MYRIFIQYASKTLTLGIKNAYTFPIVDGTAGQVLQTDGSGNTSWTTPTANTDNQKTDVFQLNGTNLELSLENDGVATQSIDLSSINATKNIIADTDNDTKIQVEESSDEDKIRFDVNGTEILVMAPNDGITATSTIKANGGIYFPDAFAPDLSYVGINGNFLSFAHIGISEDFLGYKNNAFYFRDSPGGGDQAQPSVYAASFPTYSSRRWKHNIKNLDNALSIIQQLQGVTYTWNEDHGGHDDFGFIAEEVNKILPEIAPKNAEGEVDGVEYGQLTPYLVEAIKEQQTIIEQQQQKIQELEQQVQRIDQLEDMLKQLTVSSK